MGGASYQPREASPPERAIAVAPVAALPDALRTGAGERVTGFLTVRFGDRG
jgi:hypothetical protein